MANNVSIQLTIGIPSDVVFYKVLGYGGAYGGGIKCAPNPSVDLDQAGEASLSVPTLAWGTTHGYDDDDALVVSGKPDWYRSLRPGATATATQTLPRTEDNLDVEFTQKDGATHAVKFTVVGANPLLAAAPAIDADVVVGLRTTDAGGIQYCVSGKHDGFPNYTLVINGDTAYFWDCVAKGQDPSALAPPEDQSIEIGWTDL